MGDEQVAARFQGIADIRGRGPRPAAHDAIDCRRAPRHLPPIGYTAKHQGGPCQNHKKKSLEQS
jgi:hypothetical protein